MTQRSIPWSGVAPGSGVDAGRFTAAQWWGIWASFMRSAGLITDSTTTLLRTLAALTNLGVFYSVGNQLEVTNPGAAANTIQIDTGASIVEGGFHYNNVAVTFTVPSSRTNDLIVVRKNYSGSTYTPPASVDADEQVPAYTSRITRVTALVQDTSRATYWDVPLADFTTDGAGAVTLNSDDREYVDVEIKKHFSQFHSAYNSTAAADIVQITGKGFAMVAAANSTAYANWRVPQDYISGMECKVVVLPDSASCNVIVAHHGRYSNCDEDWQLNYDRYVATATAVAGTDTHNCIAEINLDGSVAGSACEGGELVHFNATREDAGSPAGDTCGTLWYMGVRIEYLGWR